MKTINTNAIINEFKSVTAIRKNQDTIMEKYGIEYKKDFVNKVLKPCQAKINEAIAVKFDGAIDKVKDGTQSLLDALNRAKKDRKFINECRKIDFSLDGVDNLIKSYYKHVSINGKPLKKVIEYKKDENGDYILDKDEKRIKISEYFDFLDITHKNASIIIVNCLENMKKSAKNEYTNKSNIEKVGK